MTALPLLVLAFEAAAGAMSSRAEGASVQGDSARCAHLDGRPSVRRVQTSSAFGSAIRALRSTLRASFPQERGVLVGARLDELCGSMKIVQNGLFDLGPVVYFEIGLAGEAQVVAFGVGEREVVLLNPMYEGRLTAGLSTEAWNRFADSAPERAGRDELWAIAYACLLNRLSRNMDPAGLCQGEEGMTIRPQGQGWVVTLQRLGASITLSNTGRLLVMNEPP